MTSKTNENKLDLIKRILEILIVIGIIILAVGFINDVLNERDIQDWFQFGINFLLKNVNLIELTIIQLFGFTLGITITLGGLRFLIIRSGKKQK